MPRLFIMAGPNGVGKTTFARQFLPKEMQCWEYLNVDMMAAGLSPFDVDSAVIAAGRLMIRRLEELLAARSDFGFETTLSGRGYLPWLRQAKSAGYHVSLFFLWVPELKALQARVEERTRKGGHNIPEDVQRRRFPLGVRNLVNVYRPFLDQWSLFDSRTSPPELIAEEKQSGFSVINAETLALVQRSCDVSFMEGKAPMAEEAPIIGSDAMRRAAERAMRRAHADAILENLRWGLPMIEWKESVGVVRVPAENRAAYARRVLEVNGEEMSREELHRLLPDLY